MIADLWAVAQEHDWIEASVIEWLVSPTTYLAGQRPVDVIDTPDRLLAESLLHDVPVTCGKSSGDRCGGAIRHDPTFARIFQTGPAWNG